MMIPTMQNYPLLLAIASLAVFLQGCTFGNESQNCSGDACSCELTFHAFWARIRVSGVQIEHASATYSIPDVAKHIENASVSPCCNAIYDQIDYDQGKKASMPNKTVDSFANSCAKSPNKDIAAAAAAKNSSADSASLLTVRRLRSLASEKQTLGNKLSYQPIDDGQVGQDCYLDASKGFKLNGVPIASGTMNLRIRWVDPNDAATSCCDALKPVLSFTYIEGRSEADLPNKTMDDFCERCKHSNNHDIALAAYRCFGSKANTPLLA
jgi:hypothetical protein